MFLLSKLHLKFALPIVAALGTLLALTGAGPAYALSGTYSGYVAFNANGSDYLYMYDASSGSSADIKLGMAPGTSPAMNYDATANRYTVTFQNTQGYLCVYQYTTGNKCTGYGMDTSSSPALTGIPNSAGMEIAFQGANNHYLWLYNSHSGGLTDTKLGMAPGTSPAIINYFSNPSNLTYDGWMVAFQNTQGHLCVYVTSIGNRCTGLGMSPGTSPSLTDAFDGGVVAFNANATNDLYLYNYAGSGTSMNTRDVMYPYTSPSAADVYSDGIKVAYQGANGNLTIYNSYDRIAADEGAGMAFGTSPSIMDDSATGIPGNQWEIAFQANSGILWMFDMGHLKFDDTHLGLDSGTSPSAYSF